jgi:heme/copper-type cytochrome/quinol oxidase subunit 2
MNAMKMIAVVLVVAGTVGAYGSVTYTKDEHTANPDAVDPPIEEKETVQVPLWVGVAVITAGGMLFVVARRRS